MVCLNFPVNSDSYYFNFPQGKFPPSKILPAIYPPIILPLIPIPANSNYTPKKIACLIFFTVNSWSIKCMQSFIHAGVPSFSFCQRSKVVGLRSFLRTKLLCELVYQNITSLLFHLGSTLIYRICSVTTSYIFEQKKL